LIAAPVAYAQTSSTTTTTTTRSDTDTIWQKIKGSWNQTKGAVKEQWGKLTDDDLDQIQGRSEQLIGKLQARYGIARDEAKRQFDAWMHSAGPEPTPLR
jgi:uncharacterized protein YjbJ (UPF0337 family)